jgi:hypothetical protein
MRRFTIGLVNVGVIVFAGCPADNPPAPAPRPNEPVIERSAEDPATSEPGAAEPVTPPSAEPTPPG